MLGLKAVNCQTGDTLAQEQVTAASKEKVLDALGEAASKLRGELGESLATVQKFDVPLAEATTSSLEALKAYSLGRKAVRERPHPSPALRSTRHRTGSELCDGYWAVGEDYDNWARLGRASEYFTKAFQLREHVSEREKLSDRRRLLSECNWGSRIKRHRLIRRESNYPRDAGVYGNLGIVYASQGQYEKAAEAYAKPPYCPGSSIYGSPSSSAFSPCNRFEKPGNESARRRREKLDDTIAPQCSVWFSLSRR